MHKAARCLLNSASAVAARWAWSVESALAARRVEASNMAVVLDADELQVIMEASLLCTNSVCCVDTVCGVDTVRGVVTVCGDSGALQQVEVWRGRADKVMFLVGLGSRTRYLY